jgi:hypothetical protein
MGPSTLGDVGFGFGEDESTGAGAVVPRGGRDTTEVVGGVSPEADAESLDGTTGAVVSCSVFIGSVAVDVSPGEGTPSDVGLELEGAVLSLPSSGEPHAATKPPVKQAAETKHRRRLELRFSPELGQERRSTRRDI